jgi:Outer membrane protein beta-barrel domain
MKFSKTMKSLQTTLLFCLLSLATWAQTRKPDLIHKKDKSVIEAIIVEIDDEQIQYRKFSSPTGPVFGIKRNELSKIVYSNGDTEMISGKADKSDKVSKAKEEDKPAKVSKSEKTEKVKKVSKSDDSGGGLRFSVGLRGGLNLNTFSKLNADLDPTDKIQQVVGFHGGLVMELGGKIFSVQPEILFSQIGVKMTHTADPADPTDENGNLKVSGNTVTVPVLLKAKFGGSDNLKFFVNAGPYVSYLLSSRAILVSGSTTVFDETAKFTDNKGRIGYGAMAGGGVELGLGFGKLLIEGRYALGLGDNEGTTAGMAKNDSFPRSIMGSVGILIPIGGK